MSRVFSGAVLLPGETGSGLTASLELDEALVKLLSGDDELGSWDRTSCDVSPSGKGAFDLVLGSESLTFTPTSPSAFAEAMSVPLAPDPTATTKSDRPTFDYDAAIDEVIARVTPDKAANSDGEILSKPMLVGIVGISTMLMAGLATASMML